MPFSKTGPNSYTGPSGKNFNLKQVQMYYANGGKFPGQKKKAKGKPKAQKKMRYED